MAIGICFCVKFGSGNCNSIEFSGLDYVDIYFRRDFWYLYQKISVYK